jgi:hypothetical protein
MSGIRPDQFEYWYRRAFERLNCDPINDVALIAKTIKYMVRRDKLKGLGECQTNLLSLSLTLSMWTSDRRRSFVRIY